MSAQVVTIPPKGKRVPGVAPKSQRSARFSQQAVSAATRKPCPCRLSAYEVHEYGLGEEEIKLEAASPPPKKKKKKVKSYLDDL